MRPRPLPVLLSALLCVGCAGTPPHAEQPAAQQPAPKGDDAAAKQAPSLDYFVGSWDAEFKATQAFSKLEVAADGRFTFDVTMGPEVELEAKPHTVERVP